MNLIAELNKACRENKKRLEPPVLTLLTESEARRRAHIAICASKQRFPTKRIAKQAAKRIARHGRDPRLRAYSCSICGHWHLKTRNKNGKKMHHLP